MKKILIILITIPLIFGSCKKEEENNNNNSNQSLEQTKWTVNSIMFTYDGLTEIWNLPVSDEEGWDTGILEVEWTFFNNNGFFVEKYTNWNPDGDGINYTFHDTLIYTYYENLNTILLNDPTGNDVSILEDNYNPDGDGVQIIEFNSNTLNLEFTDNTQTDVPVTCTLFLSKIQ